ncbi:MAG: hypothetical protein ACRDKZ_06735 [Actinomycetota bacterium]
MKRIIISTLVAALLGLVVMPAAANHSHKKTQQGPRCGTKFIHADECSFRYEGGQLYLSGTIRGRPNAPSGATVRLETRSQTTGTRYLLLSCTYASGGCAAGGRYTDIEDLRKGQKLFCTVEGYGRGIYECGTIIKKR